MAVSGKLTDLNGNIVFNALEIHLDESDPNDVRGYFDIAAPQFTPIDVDQQYHLDLVDGRTSIATISIRPYQHDIGHRCYFHVKLHR